MIVIVGSPIARPRDQGMDAAGLPAAIARDAAEAGAAVEIVGRVGDDPAGDAVLLALAAARVGHVAVLREAGRLTPAAAPPSAGPDTAPAGPNAGSMLDGEDAAPEVAGEDAAGLSMDAADLELALRYLPDYRVVIVADDLDGTARATVAAAAAWSGAHLIVLVAAGRAASDLPADATVLERPAAHPDGAFARVVARYAVALDQGREPGAAFSEAWGTDGWAAVTN